jgi:mRNA interferase RelE/StbE
MKIEFTKRFEKQLDKIKENKLREEISIVVKECLDKESLYQIQSVKKLKGYKNFYRIRTGNYRIGISLENDLVIFCAIYDRKEFYKFFP